MDKRIVVKIGSNVISRNGRLDESVLAHLVDQVVALRTAGVNVVVVTSGAVAVGREILGKDHPSRTTEERQVLSAVGQAGLMARYRDLFSARGLHCAQVLVTKSDFRDRDHYANMKTCFENLFSEGIVPIANENDTVAIKELGFSDNDELAALIGAQLNAEMVVFLSTVDGVLSKNGGEERVLRKVDAESLKDAMRHVTKERSVSGTGGMENKFKLAKKLMEQGIVAIIANGARTNVLTDILDGKDVGTRFVAEKKLSAVKRRLAYAEGLAKGAVYVDRGAEEMLLSKSFKSLLPVGVTKVEGMFEKGDTIEIRNAAGKRIGSGVAQYDSRKASEEAGKKGGKALVHYDYLFIE